MSAPPTSMAAISAASAPGENSAYRRLTSAPIRLPPCCAEPIAPDAKPRASAGTTSIVSALNGTLVSSDATVSSEYHKANSPTVWARSIIALVSAPSTAPSRISGARRPRRGDHGILHVGERAFRRPQRSRRGRRHRQHRADRLALVRVARDGVGAGGRSAADAARRRARKPRAHAKRSARRPPSEWRRASATRRARAPATNGGSR